VSYLEITVFELRLKVFLYKDIEWEECAYRISKVIDTVLVEDKQLQEFHEKNCFKNYVFGGLAPFEKDRVYKKDHIYHIQLRTVDRGLAEYFNKNLEHFYNDYMNILSVEIKVLSKKYIDRLYCLTPIILKDYGAQGEKQGYWRSLFSIDFFERRIFENLIKKYNAFTGNKLSEDFELFTSIDLKNGKPIPFEYKGIKLLGDKADLTVNSNESAQNLAYFALGVGLGECNARGAGFINYKSI